MSSLRLRALAMLPLLASAFAIAPVSALVRPETDALAPALSVGADAAAAAASPSSASSQRVAALERLAAHAEGPVAVGLDPASGLPRSIHASRGGALAPALGGSAEAAARAFLKENRALWGATESSLRALELDLVSAIPAREARQEKDAHEAGDAGGATDLRFRQVVDGVPVYRGEIRVHTDARGRLTVVLGALAAGLERVEPATLDAATAAGQVALDLGRAPETLPVFSASGLASAGGIPARVADAGDPTGFGLRASRAIFPLPGGGGRPAWIVGLGVRAPGGPGGGHVPAYYEVAIDAVTGETLARVNLVTYAGGLAFPESSPPLTASGCPLGVAPEDVAFDPTPGSPFGYVDPALSGTFGNNVRAEGDRANVNFGPPAPPTAAGRWDHVWQNSYHQSGNALPDLYAVTTNVFYWTNRLHDRFLARGFDEPWGNFQRENLGRGGLGEDPVWADCEDGGGTSNANFAVDVDGIAPRMQLYLFPATQRDSDVDNTIVAHELAHGLTSRMVGVGCLWGHEAASMGEGWSDFFATSVFDIPIVAAYVTDDCTRGIRRSSYAVGVYPYTYGDLCTGTMGCEVHDDGEVWAATLWKAREAVAAAAPDRATAACILETLVVAGLKLTPCNPTMLDARDAILAAARDHHPELQCLLWGAFADYGMGLSATTTGAASPTGRQEAFDVPAECAACGTPLPAPTTLVADTSAPNQVTLTWDAVPGAAAYEVALSSGACGQSCAPPGARLLATVTSPVFADPGLTGAIQRTYVVRAVGTPLCAGDAACVEATPTGHCTELPRFKTDRAGVLYIGSRTAGDCGLTVNWGTAVSACPDGPDVVYNIYRSLNPVFLPVATNLLTSVPAPLTSYLDATVLPSTTYTYIVRAEDATQGGSGPNGGNEEGNLVRRSSPTFGLQTGTSTFQDGMDPAPAPGWAHGAWPAAVPDDWAPVTDAWSGGSNAWHTASVDAQTFGVGTAIRELVLPPRVLTPTSRLSFEHKMNSEPQWDGGVLEISTDGGNTWRDLTPQITTGGYNGTTLAMMTFLNLPNGNRFWTGTLPTGFAGFQSVTVDLSSFASPLPALLRFRAFWDATTPVAGLCQGPAGATYCGWYIDNVQVTDTAAFGACVAGPTCAANAVATALGPTGYCLGGTVRLDASGSSLPGCAGGLLYQWYRDGIPVPGATGVMYDMPRSLPPGTYACTVEVACSAAPPCTQMSPGVDVTIDATPPLAPVGALLAVRPPGQPADVVFSWLADPSAAGGYHIYRVGSKSLIPDSRSGQAGVTLAGATLPNPAQTTFTDAGIVPGQPVNPDLLFYQVLSVCSDGLTEGPN